MVVINIVLWKFPNKIKIAKYSYLLFHIFPKQKLNGTVLITTNFADARKLVFTTRQEKFNKKISPGGLLNNLPRKIEAKELYLLQVMPSLVFTLKTTYVMHFELMFEVGYIVLSLPYKCTTLQLNDIQPNKVTVQSSNI